MDSVQLLPAVFQSAAFPMCIWIISLPIKPSVLWQVLMLLIADRVSAGDFRLSVDSLPFAHPTACSHLLKAYFSHLNARYV